MTDFDADPLAKLREQVENDPVTKAAYLDEGARLERKESDPEFREAEYMRLFGRLPVEESRDEEVEK